jgi:hypothetical protein
LATSFYPHIFDDFRAIMTLDHPPWRTFSTLYNGLATRLPPGSSPIKKPHLSAWRKPEHEDLLAVYRLETGADLSESILGV